MAETIKNRGAFRSPESPIKQIKKRQAEARLEILALRSVENFLNQPSTEASELQQASDYDSIIQYFVNNAVSLAPEKRKFPLRTGQEENVRNAILRHIHASVPGANSASQVDIVIALKDTVTALRGVSNVSLVAGEAASPRQWVEQSVSLVIKSINLIQDLELVKDRRPRP